jgi:diguanylate cyclase (GGDEF)-like protein
VDRTVFSVLRLVQDVDFRYCMAGTAFSRTARTRLYEFISRRFGPSFADRKGRLLQVRLAKQTFLADLPQGEDMVGAMRDFVLDASDSALRAMLEIMVSIEFETASDADAAPLALEVIAQLNELLASESVGVQIDKQGKVQTDAAHQAGIDSLEMAFRQKERVHVFHMLTHNFSTEEFNGRFEGLVGGEEQAILEKLMLGKFGRLSLSTKKDCVLRLQEFILTAPAAEVMLLLEMMPQAKLEFFRSQTINEQRLAADVAHLREQITTLLHEIGVNAAFDANGALQSGDVDKTPRQLKELADQNALMNLLPSLIREQPTVSLIFIDLDNFKTVNDRYNHDVGNECLAGFAEIASQVARGKGQLFRSFKAGDEFLILLPNFNANEAAPVAQRIGSSVEATPIGRDVKVTTSIGIACSDNYGEAASLIVAAENAMYASKVMGKNRTYTSPLDADVAAKVAQDRAKSKGR